jgi:hypothetical protein
MDTYFKIIQPLFEKYMNETNVEFEIRLGKMNAGSFDTDIGEEKFNKILRGLEKYKGWEDTKESNTSVYYKDKLRTTVDEETDDSTTIFKKSITKKNFSLKDSPYDMRFSVAKEIPCDHSDEEMEGVRTKHRKSFIRKNLSIDMTVVTGDQTDLDCEEEARYEVELEIIDPTKVNNRDTLYNIIYKVFDVLAIIS